MGRPRGRLGLFGLLGLVACDHGSAAPAAPARTMAPPCAIAGRLIDEQPAPLAGATVALTTSAADVSDPPLNAITDEAGDFALPPLELPPDAGLRIYYADLIWALPLPTCPPPRTYRVRTDQPGNANGEPPYSVVVE